jgi:hypothetical protein
MYDAVSVIWAVFRHPGGIGMNDLNKYLATCVLAASMLFANAAGAMQIPQFDKMSVNDQNTYLVLLTQGAAKALYDHGDITDGDKLVQLFNDTSNNNGEHQFWTCLDQIRALNASNAADPNNKTPPYEIENAFELMLNKNSIKVPISRVGAGLRGWRGSNASRLRRCVAGAKTQIDWCKSKLRPSSIGQTFQLPKLPAAIKKVSINYYYDVLCTDD